MAPHNPPAQDTARRKRARQLASALKALFPHVDIALRHTTPHELLVAAILSAQCTDERVNAVTPALFEKYPSVDTFASATQTELERDIFQTGFFRNKARSIIESAIRLRDVYGGVVPCTMEDLLTLRGVARKTANVILGEVCGKIEGIVVDTHVRRFAIRFDLSESASPERIEQDLMALLPKEEWRLFSHRVIRYGRTIAPARRYDTSTDPLVALYPPAGTRFRV